MTIENVLPTVFLRDIVAEIADNRAVVFSCFPHVIAEFAMMRGRIERVNIFNLSAVVICNMVNLEKFHPVIVRERVGRNREDFVNDCEVTVKLIHDDSFLSCRLLLTEGNELRYNIFVPFIVKVVERAVAVLC